jgi:hypothetical protein
MKNLFNLFPGLESEVKNVNQQHGRSQKMHVGKPISQEVGLDF